MKHHAFETAGQKAGLLVWRIQNFEPVPVPENDYGKFFSGDSYIVLSTKSNKHGDLSWDIHFWLGEETSQDESGSAAILSVELDDGLGGGPVQHREVQGYESQQFISYFKSGVRYVPGGVASGFHHAQVNGPGEKRLYQVKGKKNIRVRMVELHVKSMNRGDCFILDSGDEIYVYIGSKAKGTEKFKAISAATKIRDQDHAGRGHITVIDSSSTPSEVEHFFSELGSGSADEVADEAAGGDDVQFETTIQNEVSLYKVSDADGSLKSEKVHEKPLRQSHLDSNQDCFILDTGSSGIYVWVGKKSTAQEKIGALKMGQSFITSKNYPSWTKLKRIVEGAEPPSFKDYFLDWKDTEFHGSGRFQPYVTASNYMRKSGTAPEFMPDDGNGELKVYRVENFELEPVPEESYGFFYGGDSYVIQYSYFAPNRGHKCILYFWLGEKSTQDEKASAALHTVRLDDEMCGKALQIRVEQGHEPAHFLKIFKGRMVILMGGKASGFHNVKEESTFDASGVRLFQIGGDCEDNVRAKQVVASARSLNTNDVFLVETADGCYLWVGQGSSGWERSMAAALAGRICSSAADPQEVAEAHEDDRFWALLGGKSDRYCRQIVTADDKDANNRYKRSVAALYHCQLANNNKFTVELVPHFTQEDLCSDDVMILDSGDELYVWIGKDSEPEEKTLALKHVEHYLKMRHLAKSKVLLTIKQHHEPECFTTLFPDWNHSHWEGVRGYEDLKNQVMQH